jgi:dTMP kinase
LIGVWRNWRINEIGMTKTGLFISFEGIDGAGKSTHIEGLAAAFKDQGRHVTLTREPGGTPLAETLRELILHQPMDPLSEALLIFAARRDHLQQVIEPALARGDVVLCDRFTDATFAYQGGGRGFDLSVLSQLEQWVQGTADGIRQPDLTIWFELDPVIAAERLAGARVPDRFESQPVAFFEQVHLGYAKRADADPGRFVRIDASKTKHAVWQQITRAWVVVHHGGHTGWFGIKHVGYTAFSKVWLPAFSLVASATLDFAFTPWTCLAFARALWAWPIQLGSRTRPRLVVRKNHPCRCLLPMCQLPFGGCALASRFVRAHARDSGTRIGLAFGRKVAKRDRRQEA